MAALLLCVAVVGCVTTSDVTSDKKYWAGWCPGQTYHLTQQMELVHLSDTKQYYFEKPRLFYTDSNGQQQKRHETPIGTVKGSVGDENGDHQEIVVWNAPIGTRFTVEKLLRRNLPYPLSTSTTNGEGRLLDGTFAGTPIELFTISLPKDIGHQDYLNGRLEIYSEPVDQLAQ